MRILLAILTIAFNICYGQTKKETIDWLNIKFQNSPIASNDNEQLIRFLKISQDGNFTIQSYTYYPEILLPDFKNYNRKVIVTGNFRDLSPNSVITKVIDGMVFFYASCSKANCITMRNQGPDSFNAYTSSEVLLCITNESHLEARGKKAFMHLIMLCGGKKEPF